MSWKRALVLVILVLTPVIIVGRHFWKPRTQGEELALKKEAPNAPRPVYPKADVLPNREAPIPEEQNPAPKADERAELNTQDLQHPLPIDEKRLPRPQPAPVANEPAPVGLPQIVTVGAKEETNAPKPLSVPPVTETPAVPPMPQIPPISAKEDKPASNPPPSPGPFPTPETKPAPTIPIPADPVVPPVSPKADDTPPAKVGQAIYPIPAPTPPASPWTMQMTVKDGRNRLTLSIEKTAQFEVQCDSLQVKSPAGSVQAAGKVKLVSADMEASCEKLTIPLDSDEVILEGKATVTYTRQGQELVLRGEHLNLRLRDLPASERGKD